MGLQTGNFTAGRAVAGVSALRQKPDRAWGVLSLLDPNRFMSLFAEAPAYSMEGKRKLNPWNPIIASRSTYTMTPEIFDSSVAPNTFALKADATAVDGGTVTLTVDDSSTFVVGETLIYMDPSAPVTMRISVINSATSIDVVVGKTLTGTTVMTGSPDGSQKLLLRTVHQTLDGDTVGLGYDKELIQRINNIQFSYYAISQGFLQNVLAGEANPNGDGIGKDFDRRKLEARTDMMKARNDHMLLSPYAYTEGSGSNKRWIAKGALGWAQATYTNPDPQGAISYDSLTRYHLNGAFASGVSSEQYMITSMDVKTTIQNLFQKQQRITTNETTEFGMNISVIDAPQGRLKIVTDKAFAQDGLKGCAITLDPTLCDRNFLRDLDFKYVENLELNNVLGERAAWMVAECFMAKGDNIAFHKNILRAQA